MEMQIDATMRPSADSELAERWFFVFMAALLVVTAVAGFSTTSTALIAVVAAGQRPPPAPIVHVHAVLMSSWLLLFLAQTLQAATGRMRGHRLLGRAAFVLIPAVVLAMIAITLSGWRSVLAIPPELAAVPGVPTRAFIGNILLGQLQSVVLFSVFASWGLALRRRDSAAHRRLMLLAAIAPMGAAFDRLANLGFPSTMPDSSLSIQLYQFAVLALPLIFDTIRHGAPHRVYVAGTLLYAGTALPIFLLWNAPVWQALVQPLIETMR